MATLASCDNSAVSPDRSSPAAPITGAAVLARAADYASWETPIRVDLIPGIHPDFNSTAVDGCPFVSADGKSLYMASNRDGGLGSLDIWVATRAGENDPWGMPVNVASANSGADDFCPTISRDGHLLYFASRRGGCGGSDLFVARRRADGGFDTAEMLPCDDEPPYDAVNSPADEWGPFPVNDGPRGPTLYFSSFRAGGFAAEPAGGAADSDIYRSESHGGEYGPVELVEGVNTTADDGQPNVSRDGLELFFYSTRQLAGVSQGAADLYVSTRPHVTDPWSQPSNLGATVNSAGGETRPSLSWDGTTLYFGSVRPVGPAGGKGASDIYVTTRARVTGRAP